MKQVPEKNSPDSTTLDRGEQIAALHEKLAGHQAFGRLRGRFLQSFSTTVTGMIYGSPSTFCRVWDSYAADVRIMGNMLAQFHRDG